MTAAGAARPKRQKLAESWKVHRRALVLDGYPHTVLSVRPGDPERFATNYFHDTWHIVSDVRGGRLIGRLCWALAFQRKPGTFILIGETNLVPNPFDGDRSWPIVIANTDLGAPSPQSLARMKTQRPLARPPDGTVKLATFGLDKALRNPDAPGTLSRGARSRDERARATNAHGFVSFTATTDVLRDWGLRLGSLGTGFHRGMDYEYLAGDDGEVQIFRDFHRKVERIGVLRERLFPGREADALAPEEKARIYEADQSEDTARRAKNRNRL